MSTLALEQVSKVYADGTRAVADVDLDVDDGEFFVLLGPSGCGKSTLLRMVAGVESADRGTIRIDGDRVNEVRPSERGVAMVFQSPVLYPTMNVEQNLAFPLRLARVPDGDIADRVDDVARVLGVLDLLGRKPAQLSGGQQQRVAMGRAIVRRPRLLLMDEPMSNLDAALRSELRSYLARLQRHLATTTVYVTHDHVEAMAMADRIVLLRDGRVVQCDAPAELYDDPADLFVATFVGAPQMGLLRARVVDDDRGPGLRVADAVVRFDAAGRRRFPALAGWAGREVVLGLRSETLTVDAESELLGSAVHAEQHGAEQVVFVSFGADSLHVAHHGFVPDREHHGVAVKLRPDRVVDLFRPIPLRVDPSRVHLFDVRSGRSLRATRSTAAGGRSRDVHTGEFE